MAERVRAHTRATPSGGQTRVRNHSRAGRPRKALISPQHSWKLMKKAFRAGRKKKRATAAAFGLLAVTELLAWVTLEGASLIVATAGLLALAVGVAGAAAGGVRR